LAHNSGYEASASVSEETLNPARSAPRGIILALSCSISFGWVLLISLAFHIYDYDALVSTYGSAAVLGVFDYAVGSPAAVILGAILVVAQFFCGFSSLESNSRTVFAFARDDGLPLSRLWSRLTKTHKVRPSLFVLSVCSRGFLHLAIARRKNEQGEQNCPLATIDCPFRSLCLLPC
jgi:amino acid transporter